MKRASKSGVLKVLLVDYSNNLVERDAFRQAKALSCCGLAAIRHLECHLLTPLTWEQSLSAN